MRIALDAMAGDFGPEPLVRGAIEAVRESRHHIVLVGNAEILENILNREQALHPRLSIAHADTVIGMDELPKASLKKKTSSLAVACDLVKSGEADAVVSAGNTGATLAMTVMKWRPLPGVSRPALATVIPVPNHPVILLDVGANVDCRPRHLTDFAIMGSIYAREIFGRRTPRVGLLNIGEEDCKGSELALAAHKMISETEVNFIGNVEGGDMFEGKVDVIVCDGFVGNVVLKFAEGLVNKLMSHLKAEVSKNIVTQIGALAVKPVLRRLKNQMDASEYGGAPLLGVNGISLVCHGASNARAIKNALIMAGECVRHGINSKIEAALGGAAGGERVESEVRAPVIGDVLSGAE